MTEPKTLEEFTNQYIDPRSFYSKGYHEFAQAFLEWVRKEVEPDPSFHDERSAKSVIDEVKRNFDRLAGKGKG